MRKMGKWKWTLPLVLGWLLWGVSKLGGPLFQLPLLLAVLFEGVARTLPRARRNCFRVASP
jgi:hypothetical protein